jgi:hypothetical protein
VSGGREAFERLVAALEACEAGGDALVQPGMLDRALGGIARTARRGSVVVLLSDLLDLPDEALGRIAAVTSRGRILVVVQALDPDEAEFPFEGTVRLRSLEGGVVVETDAEVRERYLDALDRHGRAWEEAVLSRGGRFVRARTTDDPVRVVRSIVEAVR